MAEAGYCEKKLVGQIRKELLSWAEFISRDIRETNEDLKRGQMAMTHVYERYFPIMQKRIENIPLTDEELASVLSANNNIHLMKQSLDRLHRHKISQLDTVYELAGRVHRYSQQLPSLKEETVAELEKLSLELNW